MKTKEKFVQLLNSPCDICPCFSPLTALTSTGRIFEQIYDEGTEEILWKEVPTPDFNTL